jgi:uncharacterized cupredoxin-like copper-binding protein
MENNQNKTNNSKRVWILFGLLVLIVVVAIIVTNINKKNAVPTVSNEQGTENTGTTTPKAAPADLGLISPALKDAVIMIPGASPVKNNVVMTMKGEVANNNAAPMAPNAPQQTEAITKASVANDNSVNKIDVSEKGFSPNYLKVKAGSLVNIAITSSDSYTHIFAFRDASLSAVAVGVGPGETRAIIFNAPAKTGTYEFYCNVPGHDMRGEIGKMVVN